MRSSLQTRLQSLRPALALLGITGTALTLSLTPRAAAIGGGAGSASAPTSPRESGGAAPSLSLFQTSASSYTGGSGGSGSGSSSGSGTTSSSEVTSSGNAAGAGEERPSSRRKQPDAASSERGESAGRQRTARRREREEGGTAAGSSGRRDQVSANGKAVVDNSKGGKDAVVTRPPAPGPIFTLSGGYQTRYMYHGLDIISFNSRYRNNLSAVNEPFKTRAESSGIYFTDASVEFKGLRAGINYVQAVDPTVPFFYKSEAGRTNALPGDRVSLYRELNVHLDYTLSIVPNWLDATVGYNSFFFLNGDFKGTNYQGEVPIRLTFTRIPFVRPSFTFYRYISDYKDYNAGNLNGNYVEFRLDGAFPIVDKPNFGLAIAPYVVASYNINYLKFSGDYDIGGWNTLEAGIKLPVRVGKHFTVTPFGNYGQNLSSAGTVANNFAASNLTGNTGSRSFGESTRFWGGVNLSYTF